jgi:hypothetical protein
VVCNCMLITMWVGIKCMFHPVLELVVFQCVHACVGRRLTTSVHTKRN